MQVLAVKDRADHDAPGFGVGTEVPRQKLHGKGMGGLGSLLQSPGVIRRLFDGTQRLPHVCRQAVDEGPPLGEELRGVAARVVATLADPDPGQGHELGELAKEPVPAADSPGDVRGARPMGAGTGRRLAGAQLEAEPELSRRSPKDAELRHPATLLRPGPPGRYAADRWAGFGAAPEPLRLPRTGGGQSSMGRDDAGAVDHEIGHQGVSPIRPGAGAPGRRAGNAGRDRGPAKGVRRATSRP